MAFRRRFGARGRRSFGRGRGRGRGRRMVRRGSAGRLRGIRIGYRM